MTFTAAGSLQAGENAVAGTSTTFSLTTTATGDFVLAEICANNHPAASITSTRCTWVKLTPDYTLTANGSSTFCNNVWLGTVNSAGSDTVTVTFGVPMGGANVRFDAREFHSSLGSLALDAAGTVNSMGTPSWATLTPSGAGRLYWGWCEDFGSAVSGVTPGFTYENDLNGNASGYCLSVSAAYTPVWGDSGHVAGVMVLLSEGSAAAFASAAALSGSGALSSLETVTFASAVTLSGSGALAGAGRVVQPAAAALGGSGTLTAPPAVKFTEGCTLSGAGSLAASALAVQPAAAVLSGSGSAVVSAAVRFTASVPLAGGGTLTAAALAVQPGAAPLAGQGTVTVAVTLTAPSGVTLSGTGALSAGPALKLTAAAHLTGTGTVTAAATVIRPVTEPPVLWSVQPSAARWAASGTPARWLTSAAAARWLASPATARWACTPSALRWRVIVTAFPNPISALSLEEANVTWFSDLDGTSVDPTGQASGQPELPVQFAFPVSSGDVRSPNPPVTWYAGSWLQGGTGRGYVAQALIGPGGGVVTLSAGQYDTWSKITGSPESPVKFVGVLTVY